MRRTHGSRLVAVWPGMGQVALTAGYYLMSKLRMREERPVRTTDLFGPDHIEVDKGLARVNAAPEDHLFVSHDDRARERLNLMIGEAQPVSHGVEYCRRILDRAEKLGVGQVITFSAAATDCRPEDPSKVLGVATRVEGLDALQRHGIEVLEGGQIMGMNGLFLAAAAERGLSGLCLIGLIPAFASTIPYPKASHAVLEAFSRLVEMPIDLGELEEYGRLASEHLSSGLAKLQEALEGSAAGDDPPAAAEEPADLAGPPAPQEPALAPEERDRIDALFQDAAKDPSKAFELKRELDRLSAFKLYENRFLDLFRHSG